MARRELPSRLGALLRPGFRPCALSNASPRLRSPVSTAAAAAVAEVGDLEHTSTFTASLPSAEDAKGFDPVAASKKRQGELPASRYRYRPPKYYRGPLHPHQPPPKADPASREFIPGPFMYTRMEQTFDTTIAPDFMTLTYQHFPPGFEKPAKAQRLRQWVGDSPYFKNRPLRGPRGGAVLPKIRQPITFRNVPKITGVTIHSMVKQAAEDNAYLHVAGMIVQAISNVRVTTHRAKTSVVQWGAKAGKTISVTAHLKNEDAYNFLSKTIDVVLPRIKEWKGVRGSSGNSAGHIAFGLRPEDVALYPEVEVNYDAYPPRMIPGCHVIIHTSADEDRDARMLLEAIGLPFYGRYVD